MLNSGIFFSNSRVVRKTFSERNKKTYPPPPPCMLNGRYLMVNLGQLTKMLNGNKEKDYRHRLKYTECVVLHVCYIYIALSSGMF